MKQEQSIENNFNESRGGFVDQELGMHWLSGNGRSTALRGSASNSSPLRVPRKKEICQIHDT